MGMSSHQPNNSKTTEWLTPPEILNALGPFDLDPCAPVNRPWDMARHHFTINDDGLSARWFGRVWLNPPFNRYEAPKWLKRMAEHRNGIALIPARTETRMFFDYVWGAASAVLFMRGRPHFHRVDGTRAKANSGAPIALVAYGEVNSLTLYEAGLGKYLDLRWLSVPPKSVVAEIERFERQAANL